MTSKEFLKRIENHQNIKGLYLVRHYYISTDKQINNSYKVIIWGFYPYEIEKIIFSNSGRLIIECIIINRLGTTTNSKKDILSLKPQKIYFNSAFEFFENESEAINECHLRNLGKQPPKGGFAQDLSDINKIYSPQQVADIYY